MKNNIKDELEYHDSLLVSVEQEESNYSLVFECVWDHELSPAKQLIGNLFLYNVTKIMIKEDEIKDLVIVFEYGSVLDLNLKDDHIELNVIWTKFNPNEEKYAFYKIYCDEVKWDPIRIHDPVKDR